MKTDMTTTYLGLALSHPVVASAGPLTGRLDTLLELEAAGAAAVVLPSLFEEQIEHEALNVDLGLEYGAGYQPEAASGYFPELDDYKTGPDEYLNLLERASNALSIPVIGSLNGVSSGGWTSYARQIQDAGAAALELNIYLVASDITLPGTAVEDQYLHLVREVKNIVTIPLSVKIGPYFSSPGHMAHRLVDAGADGLVLFNRFYQPDIDLEDLTVSPNLILSTSIESRLALRWIGILRSTMKASLAATTGIHTGDDAVKMILAGADVTMMTSALLKHGPYHIAEVVAEMTQWFTEREYNSVEQARGSVSYTTAADPTGYERANYMKTLKSYSPNAISRFWLTDPADETGIVNRTSS
ncbi:MAG: dihydroorotate dehydrogenase-like protein [Acidimicrobiia bacterium]|nr:dihydroorotate dehydrogenase-like protein [Acidimicrobiia bacterium]